MTSTSPSLPRVALYARVSTEEQREGQTIDSQVAELERFAATQDWIIAEVYRDDGWSGSILARPALDRLRDEASKGSFAIVLINDVDRLARDVAHLGIIKRDLERNGVQVRFRKLPAEQSPTYNLMVNILGSFAEFERELITDRTRRGRRHKVEVRQKFLGSLPPYGYRYIRKDSAADQEGYLEILPEEAAVVKQMYEWVDREGLSARQVIRRLSELRVVPHKGGKRWGKSIVQRILHRETYTGVWHYNKHESFEPVKVTRQPRYHRLLKSALRVRPYAEWIPVRLSEELRIIDRAQWERVQQQIVRNTAFSPRNTKHSYLLIGLLRCGACGARYIGDPNHGTFYYRCAARCRNYPSIREVCLNETVWKAVTEAILNPAVIVNQLHERQRRARADTTKLERERGEISQTEKAMDAEEARIIEAYRLSILTAAELGRELEKFRLRKAAVENRKAALAEAAKTLPPTTIRQSVLAFCHSVAQGLQIFTWEERRQFLRLLIDSIVYEGDQVRIKGVIPVTPPSDQETENENLSENGQTVTTVLQGSQNSYRIAAPSSYLQARNTVEQLPFHLFISLPKKERLLNAEFLQYVYRLTQEQPGAPLRELCERVRQERGLTVSISSMSRAKQRLDSVSKMKAAP